ncbi:hypothetical protein D3C80_2180000 [compost metagenome]
MGFIGDCEEPLLRLSGMDASKRKKRHAALVVQHDVDFKEDAAIVKRILFDVFGIIGTCRTRENHLFIIAWD